MEEKIKLPPTWLLEHALGKVFLKLFTKQKKIWPWPNWKHLQTDLKLLN